MIVVDTSALVAIIFREPEGDAFLNLLFETEEAIIAAPTVLEAVIVVRRRRGEAGRGTVEALIAETGIRVEAWGQTHLAAAQEAFTRFGKGQNHPAKLNFGDCVTYALARTLNAPLLFKGDDFARTDIRVAP